MPLPGIVATEAPILPALRGKIALVLGGTRGVGRATSAKLAASGCDVVATYAADDEAAEALRTDLVDLPGTVTTVRADARRPDALATAIAGIPDGRPLDVLVHSVPSMRPMPVLGADLGALLGDVSAALTPLLSGAADVAGRMAGRDGRIVVVSASVARTVAPGFVSLAAAKSALESVVRYLAVELAPRGIAVNAVSAGKLDKGAATTLPEVAARLAARTPAGRLATPGDVADAVALLCLPEARFVQGQVVHVDGGLHLLG